MEKIIKDIIKEALAKRVSDQETFLSIIKKTFEGKKIATFPSNIIMRRIYQAMIEKGEIQPSKTLEKILVTKKMRSLSGVAIITVLTKPWPCPGKCLYCPSETEVPKSYLSTEPAVRRAILCGYDPVKQVKARLESLGLEGHPTDKIELIIIGGTFSYLPREYQQSFVKSCFDALNGKISKSLETAQKINETTRHRCVGLTLETRPDFINKEEIDWFRELGATRIELGVQSVFDDVLKKNKRGHTIHEVVVATKLLKDAGFKICYHLMPNLPGSDLQKDLEIFKIIFNDSRFQPDYIKIYPCLVVKGSELYKIWQEGGYRPYTEEELAGLIYRIKKIVPYYVRIMRLIRDIPSGNIEAGSKVTNMRQVVQKKLELEKVRCHCIRCRETGLQLAQKSNLKLKIFLEEYEANQGKEIFLSFESIDRSMLLSLLRLRLTKKWPIEEINGCALIREVHTYGQQTEVGREGYTQHIGYGRKLILEAEKIAKKSGYQKIAVISGIGVRDYYRKLGYELVGTYMIKTL